MEITLLLKSIMGLVVILALLIFLLFLPSSRKKREVELPSKDETPSQKRPADTDLQSLRAIIKKKKTTTKELEEALDLIIKYHGKVHEKLGQRAHPDFDVYMDILFTICRHPNTNKDIVIKFDRELGQLNPEYKKEINEAITKGLNSRRVQ
ncbi:hypothetical protein [Sulfurimonas sp.]|uniref:hypothetical protein n=1 Tax=Sulfurimonas sp. TaxID=2022749 RepID=UPI003567672C